MLASERGGAQPRRVGLAAGSGSEQITSFLPPTPWQLQPQSEASLGCVDCPKVGYLFLSSPLSPKEIKDRPQPSNSRFLGFFPPPPNAGPLPSLSPLMDHPCAAHGYVCTPPQTPPVPLWGLRRCCCGQAPASPPPVRCKHIWFVNLSHSSFPSLPAAVSSVEFRPKMGVGDWSSGVGGDGQTK